MDGFGAVLWEHLDAEVTGVEGGEYAEVLDGWRR